MYLVKYEQFDQKRSKVVEIWKMSKSEQNEQKWSIMIKMIKINLMVKMVKSDQNDKKWPI